MLKLFLLVSIFFILILFIPFIIALFLYFFKKNSYIEIKLNKIFFIKENNTTNAIIGFEVILKNSGNFHSIILDIIPYLNPPYLNYFKLCINNPVSTYFDTIIIKKNKEQKIYCIFISKDFYNLKPEDLKQFYLSLNILYYDLKPLRTLYKEFNLKDFDKIYTDLPIELANLFNHLTKKQEVQIINKSVKEEFNIYCLKTPIITHFNNDEELINLIIEGLKLIRDKTNGSKKVLISIAESLVAIIQKRAFNIYSIEPNFLAKLFNHYFNEDSSLSSNYALNKVIQEIGFIRFYIGIIAGILGKLLNQSGWFYKVAGRKAAAVDDAGGTIRPYDKYVVLAPDNPDTWAIYFKNKLIQKLIENNLENFKNSVDIFIVDANDLGKVDILGKTDSNKDINEFIINSLKSNPQGNDDQQTPIVFIIK